MSSFSPPMYRSNNVVHCLGPDVIHATGHDKENPLLASHDKNNYPLIFGNNVPSMHDPKGNGLGKKPSYIGNNAIKVSNNNNLKHVNFSTGQVGFLTSNSNNVCASTTVKSAPPLWKPKVDDTPKADVLAFQASLYKTHWGFMNTVADSELVRICNNNNPSSPFEMLANPYNFSPGTYTIDNVGNKIRYCWIIPKSVRQGFNQRRPTASHLPSPNFFEQAANADLKKQIKGPVMIPAGASIVIKKEPLDAIIITNLDSGHGGGGARNIAGGNYGNGNKSYVRNYASNTMVEPIVSYK